MINMCYSDFIAVLCNNRNNWFSADGLGRDAAFGPWMKTCRSGLRPLVVPLALCHIRKRWDQENKEVIKINQALLSGARMRRFDLCSMIAQWHHFWRWGGTWKRKRVESSAMQCGLIDCPTKVTTLTGHTCTPQPSTVMPHVKKKKNSFKRKTQSQHKQTPYQQQLCFLYYCISQLASVLY